MRIVVRDHRGTIIKMYSRRRRWKNHVCFQERFVHAFTLDHAIPNENDSGMRIVLRDHRSTIIKMYSRRIRNLIRRANELWAMLIGLKGAFLEDENQVEFELDNKERTRLVDILHLFGEVKELRMLDMGLGTCQGEFAISEEEYEQWV
ncbi:hypothetical protein ACET3Z_010421 [Daucus carota]